MCNSLFFGRANATQKRSDTTNIVVSAAATSPANTQKRSDTTNIMVSAAASSLANTQKRSDTTNIVVSGAARSPAKHRSAQALFARPVQHKLIGTDGVFFARPV